MLVTIPLTGRDNSIGLGVGGKLKHLKPPSSTWNWWSIHAMMQNDELSFKITKMSLNAIVWNSSWIIYPKAWEFNILTGKMTFVAKIFKDLLAKSKSSFLVGLLYVLIFIFTRNVAWYWSIDVWVWRVGWMQCNSMESEKSCGIKF